jgi:hypothetical protein
LSVKRDGSRSAPKLSNFPVYASGMKRKPEQLFVSAAFALPTAVPEHDVGS